MSRNVYFLVIYIFINFYIFVLILFYFLIYIILNYFTCINDRIKYEGKYIATKMFLDN